ncbi:MULTISPECIES: histone-like nucleoid-structuring protein Lsr2 [unclassified Streptomyces]|uniref:Lsr2 family DNA-binding protein n=1 Tax=unclassified Streptomyces TaxID=2593676 RepID=UPI0035DA8269
MFTDLTVSTQAGALALAPSTAPQLAAAARTVARHARDEADLALLLDVLGLPTDDTNATDPLPETGDPDAMTNPTALPSPAPVIDVPVIPLPGSDPLQGLIEWAAAHPAASVRKRAARITADLAELSERREGEAAQREAEEKVAKARAELEKAEEALRAMKHGPRTTTTAAAVPTPTRTGTYSRDELAAIRTWARAHGHPVADRGLPSRTVLDAYAAAHPATPARKAG